MSTFDPQIDVQEKQPTETVPIDLDFARAMKADETIASVVASSAVRVAGTGVETLTMSAPSFLGQRAQAMFSGGNDGEMYLITIRVATSIAGKSIEGEGYLRIKARG